MCSERRGPREDQRAWMCDGKQRLTRDGARDLARKMSRRYSKRLSSYNCPYCNHYHVGNRTAPKRR